MAVIPYVDTHTLLQGGQLNVWPLDTSLHRILKIFITANSRLKIQQNSLSCRVVFVKFFYSIELCCLPELFPSDPLPNYTENDGPCGGCQAACLYSYHTIAYTCMPKHNCCKCEEMTDAFLEQLLRVVLYSVL